MDMKQALDGDRVKAIIDAAAAEKRADLEALAARLRADLEEYLRNAAFVEATVGQLFADAAIFAVKELELTRYNYESRQPGETYTIDEIDLRFNGPAGQKGTQLKSRYHASGTPDEATVVPSGRYRIIFALMPVKDQADK
jgi:hypothetical protein